MTNDEKIYGDCMKCGTTQSELFEYTAGYWICKAVGCWDEEVERDSGRHEILNEKLEDYKKLCQGSG